MKPNRPRGRKLVAAKTFLDSTRPYHRTHSTANPQDAKMPAKKEEVTSAKVTKKSVAAMKLPWNNQFTFKTPVVIKAKKPSSTAPTMINNQSTATAAKNPSAAVNPQTSTPSVSVAKKPQSVPVSKPSSTVPTINPSVMKNKSTATATKNPSAAVNLNASTPSVPVAKKPQSVPVSKPSSTASVINHPPVKKKSAAKKPSFTATAAPKPTINHPTVSQSTPTEAMEGISKAERAAKNFELEVEECMKKKNSQSNKESVFASGAGLRTRCADAEDQKEEVVSSADSHEKEDDFVPTDGEAEEEEDEIFSDNKEEEAVDPEDNGSDTEEEEAVDAEDNELINVKFC